MKSETVKIVGSDDIFGKTTLKTSGEDVKPHSKRVEKMRNYTRNEWGRCETTPKTSGEYVKIHSKRVEKIYKYTPNDCGTTQKMLQQRNRNHRILSVGFVLVLHSFRVWLFTSSPLVSSVVIHKFSTRFECSFTF